MNVLIKDKSTWVRAAVARQGYGLDILVHDKNKFVRLEVAAQEYGLDILANDKEPAIRDYAIEQLKSKESIQNETFEEKLDRLERGAQPKSHNTNFELVKEQER